LVAAGGKGEALVRMKIKVLKRNLEDYVRESKHDIHKLQRNYSPTEHPFEAEREYTRAVNAVKLERVFAKPFIGSLDGHRDGLTCLAKHPASLATVCSASADGEVRVWQLTERKCLASWQAHQGVVRGAAFVPPSGKHIITCGDDKSIKVWDAVEYSDVPTVTILSKSCLGGLSHAAKSSEFATCGESVQLWSHGRAVPSRTFQWGVDSVHHLKFSPVERHLLGAAASDRSIILYDTRDVGPIRRVVMNLKTNAISWNPMEAMVFSAANEDYNVYAFDMRKLDRPVNVQMDHTAAVIDLDYSPTGRELVTGSYDKTVRLWATDSGRSREIYHTKRMQRLTCVAWSGDNKYVVSASDEMCLRLWKARASEKLGVMKDRERVALQYNEKLKEKYGQHPKVSRIARHRQVPRHVKSAQAELKLIKEGKARKEANRRKHSKPGAVPYLPEREAHTIEEKE